MVPILVEDMQMVSTVPISSPWGFSRNVADEIITEVVRHIDIIDTR